MRLPVITQRPALGTFGKGAPGIGHGLNFGPSGGANCPNECQHHPESTNPSRGARSMLCREVTRPDRQTLAAKEQRHEDRGGFSHPTVSPVEANAAAGYVPIWLRVSAFEVFPNTHEAK